MYLQPIFLVLTSIFEPSMIFIFHQLALKNMHEAIGGISGRGPGKAVIDKIEVPAIF